MKVPETFWQGWEELNKNLYMNNYLQILKKKLLPCSVLCHKNVIISFTYMYIYYMANVF